MIIANLDGFERAHVYSCDEDYPKLSFTSSVKYYYTWDQVSVLILKNYNICGKFQQ